MSSKHEHDLHDSDDAKNDGEPNVYCREATARSIQRPNGFRKQNDTPQNIRTIPGGITLQRRPVKQLFEFFIDLIH